MLKLEKWLPSSVVIFRVSPSNPITIDTKNPDARHEGLQASLL